VPVTLATEYLRKCHPFFKELPLFFLLWICHIPGDSGKEYTGCDFISLNPQQLSVLIPQPNRCWLRGWWCHHSMSCYVLWVTLKLLLVASGRTPCYCESQQGEQNMLSLCLLSVAVYTWKSTQNYFRRKVLCRCITPENDLVTVQPSKGSAGIKSCLLLHAHLSILQSAIWSKNYSFELFL